MESSITNYLAGNLISPSNSDQLASRNLPDAIIKKGLNEMELVFCISTNFRIYSRKKGFDWHGWNLKNATFLWEGKKIPFGADGFVIRRPLNLEAKWQTVEKNNGTDVLKWKPDSFRPPIVSAWTDRPKPKWLICDHAYKALTIDGMYGVLLNLQRSDKGMGEI